MVKWNEAAVTLFSAAALPPPVIGRAVFVTHNCLYDTWAAYNDTAIGLYWPRGFQRERKVRLGPWRRAVTHLKARSLSIAWLPSWHWLHSAFLRPSQARKAWCRP